MWYTVAFEPANIWPFFNPISGCSDLRTDDFTYLGRVNVRSNWLLVPKQTALYTTLEDFAACRQGNPKVLTLAIHRHAGTAHIAALLEIIARIRNRSNAVCNHKGAAQYSSHVLQRGQSLGGQSLVGGLASRQEKPCGDIAIIWR